MAKDKARPAEAAAKDVGGMFGLDKTIGRGRRLDQDFKDGDQFIIWGIADILTGIPTSVDSEGTKVIFEVAELGTPDDHFELGTFASAIVSKAQEASANDFPAVVQVAHAHSDQYNTEALILKWIRDYDKDSPKEAAKTTEPPF